MSRLLRFSLRTLAVFVLISAVAFANFFYEFRRAQAREAAVERLVGFPGYVLYEGKHRATADQLSPEASDETGKMQRWITEQLGVDMFCRVERICLSGRETFSDEDFASACRLRSMKAMRLGRTSITDEGFACVGQLRDLERLALASPHLTDRSLDYVAELEKLEYFTLHDSKITDEAVAALQSRLPDCQIDW